MPISNATIPAGQMAEMGNRIGVTAAAWPSSSLLQAIDTCQRCDSTEVCHDWLGRAPQTITKVPEFCPNASEFGRLMKAGKRD